MASLPYSVRSLAHDRQVPRKIVYLLCFGALAIVASYATRGFVVDDAFITFRYGKHLAEQGHATWNATATSPAPFGFTTIAWMLMSALWALLVHGGNDVLLCARITSAASLGVAMILIASRFVRVSSLPAGLLLGALTFGVWSEGIHVNSGMETLTFSVVILAVLWARDREQRPIVAYAVSGAAMLVRPEGAVCFVVLAWVDVHARRYRDAVIGCAFGALVLAVVLMVLHHAYGSITPSAVALKVGPLRPKLSSSRAIAVFLVFYALVPLVACIRAARVDSTARLALALSAAMLAAVSLVYPIMNVQARYEWPVLFLLSYGGASGLRGLRWPAFTGLAGAGLTCAVLTGVVALRVAICGREQYIDSRAVGSALRSASRGKGTVALVDAGTLAYYADLDTRDVTGLADGRVERSARTAQEIICDADVTHAMFVVVNNHFEDLGLDKCGFAQRAITPYVCGDRSEAVYIFSRDADTLERLPPPAPPRDDCYFAMAREGWHQGVYALDTEL